ncbi:unnamed protein product [Clonostachys chloroleuca]|uniref:Peptidase S8/S53 domain-containing protein n=1 Tax=Clonostachys chloroleuca TaxID=1926264 RepID=A0AA35Q7J7_9HYPO|nr:unnamed protein product [Clonostachys chloroleuca]
MRPVSQLLVLLALVLGTAARSYHRHEQHTQILKDPGERHETGGTNKYIIEVEKGTRLGTLAKRFEDESQVNGTYYKEFDCSDVFSGLTIESKTDNVDSLLSIEGVVNVWPLRSVPMAPLAKRRKLSGNMKHPNTSAHHWTGVDKLHKAGIRGKGATVAVIDTGIDYTHKALGGCFGPGCKVSGGYDLVGADWDSHEEMHFPKRPDDDPRDFYGHGTHVAGIIAGKSHWFTGVAPDADLLIYKVFSDDPLDTDEEVLIQAFCDAYSAGADIITASIGRPNGFVDNPWALVASRLVQRGIVVTISAGNEGYTGPIYSSSGSNGDGVISVAAVNATGNTNDTVDSRSIAAYFSTWGPTNELLLKPDIAAPGFDIVSTVLDGEYEEMSGTSMAAPYIAGVAALWIGKYGGRAVHGPKTAKLVSERITTSGSSVAWSADIVRFNQTAPPFQVGTGLVNALKVLHYDTQISAKPFSLLDTESFQPDWTANITNRGNTSVTFTFEVEPQSGMELLDSYYGIKTLFELTPISIVPNITLPKPITVPPMKTKTAEFSFQLPKVNDELLPLYGGKIWFKGSNGESLSVPYGGAAYDTEKEFDSMFATQPYINEFENDWKWSFNTNVRPYDFVELSARLRYPCSHLRWDIFSRYWDERSWVLPTIPGENGYIGSATTFRDADMFWYFDPKRMDKEDTIPFPIMRVPRGYGSYWWFGKLANGSYIRPGNYTMRFAALRPYGNPNLTDHWDVMGQDALSFEVLPMNTTRNSTRLIRHAYT